MEKANSTENHADIYQRWRIFKSATRPPSGGKTTGRKKGGTNDWDLNQRVERAEGTREGQGTGINHKSKP